jgi:hypothetical protein
MSKQSASKVVAHKVATTGKKVGNAKKPAKNQMISTWNEVNEMTVAEFVANTDRLDLDKLVNYKADPYFVKADVKKAHPKEAFFIPVEGIEGKTHKFMGQSDAMAIGSFVERDPIVAILQLIAYRRGNPYI